MPCLRKYVTFNINSIVVRALLSLCVLLVIRTQHSNHHCLCVCVCPMQEAVCTDRRRAPPRICAGAVGSASGSTCEWALASSPWAAGTELCWRSRSTCSSTRWEDAERRSAALNALTHKQSRLHVSWWRARQHRAFKHFASVNPFGMEYRTFSNHYRGDQNGYFKPKHNLFLTVPKPFKTIGKALLQDRTEP